MCDLTCSLSLTTFRDKSNVIGGWLPSLTFVLDDNRWLERISEICGLLSYEDFEESVHRPAKCPHRGVNCVLRLVGSAHIDSANFGGKGHERHRDSQGILGASQL
jgi:hypothetical protein